MVYSAFILGIMGSLHCLGMCGPLSLLVPANKSRYLLGRLLYNTGRISTYVLLGLLTGVVGQQAGFFFPQKIIFFSLGAILLLYILLPSHWKNRLSLWRPVQQLAAFTRRGISRLSKRAGFAVQYGFGLINGLIPCGLVYAALSGAFLTAGIKDAALFMFFFGLGTLPMMMSFGVIGKFLPAFLKVRPQLLYTITYGIMGIFFLYKATQIPAHHYANTHEITICRTP